MKEIIEDPHAFPVGDFLVLQQVAGISADDVGVDVVKGIVKIGAFCERLMDQKTYKGDVGHADQDLYSLVPGAGG